MHVRARTHAVWVDGSIAIKHFKFCFGLFTCRMADDILRQAELRHLRRPRSRQGEDVLPLDGTKTKVDSFSYLRINL